MSSMVLPAHPALMPTKARLSLYVILVLRAIFFAVFIVTLDNVVPLGTSLSLLTFGAIMGIWCGAYCSFTFLSHFGFFVSQIGIWIVFKLAFWFAGLVPVHAPAHIFVIYNIEQHVALALAFFFLASFTTWGYWRMRYALTFELLFLIGIVIYVLSGHRNFHFDTPQILNTIAWDLGIEQLTLLVSLGVAIVGCILVYLFVGTLPSRPVANLNEAGSDSHLGRVNILLAILGLLGFSAVVAVIADRVYSHYNQVALTRIANGVGEEKTEGMSPLGFHSALGGTNQPAALVRLEGDYKENPFTPMMYLRESALSQFNGHEMVLAGKAYDKDVSGTSPKEAFIGAEDVELGSRRPLVQSIYLIGDHKNVFAVDYPVSIAQLKNPSQQKFRSAYRAYSVAPAFTKEEMTKGSVGDSRWSKEVREHYLAVHPDVRYTELAKNITKNAQTPLDKAYAITAYLSQTSIYTLTPNHTVAEDEDQVAPFLFGDHRGYCVHFAHAMVYMFRAMGIPSRIGTGYLTDLSQAKDGHILLRMSDRHAWAEIFIDHLGWVPFDIQPQQVESHADTQVDMKMLEELMGLLDPGEEILPSEVVKDEPNFNEKPGFYVPGKREISILLAAFLVAIVLLKMHIMFGWALPGNSAYRIRRSYIAIEARLNDLGHHRRSGETRLEFRQRLAAELGTDALSLTDLLNLTNYSQSGPVGAATSQIDAMRKEDFSKLHKQASWRRFVAMLNPASVFHYLLNFRLFGNKEEE